MQMPPIVSATAWQQARDELLVAEKEATRALDALAAKRRRLPMVKFDSGYAFTGPRGTVSLLDLFDGRHQLAVYQFMDNGPDDFCGGCTNFSRSVANLAGIQQRDISWATVSNMPFAQLRAYTEKMGWTFPIFSSRGTSFAEDCGCGGGFGLSVFLRDGDDVYRTYFTNGRGVDRLLFDANIFDLMPFGRQESWEDSPDGWPQRPTYDW